MNCTKFMINDILWPNLYFCMFVVHSIDDSFVFHQFFDKKVWMRSTLKCIMNRISKWFTKKFQFQLFQKFYWLYLTSIHFHQIFTHKNKMQNWNGNRKKLKIKNRVIVYCKYYVMPTASVSVWPTFESS